MTDEFLSNDRWSAAIKGMQKERTFIQRAADKFIGFLPVAVRKKLLPDLNRDINRELDRFARTHREINFVQIGSCDGMAGDPLRHLITNYRWRGVVVEPVASNFKRLVKTYANNPDVHCMNVAVADHDEVKPFFYIEEADREDFPEWVRQIGSFDRRHVEKHSLMLDGLSNYIRRTNVECLTLRSLIERSGLERVDILHTDVEGYDLEILRQIDLDHINPPLVLFEDFHMKQDDRDIALGLMREAGYELVKGGMDVLCIRRQ